MYQIVYWLAFVSDPTEKFTEFSVPPAVFRAHIYKANREGTGGKDERSGQVKEGEEEFAPAILESSRCF